MGVKDSFFNRVKRSVTKSVTFRILVMLADGLIIYAITKEVFLAIGIIIFSNISSTIIYYVHERAWNRIEWGKEEEEEGLEK